MSNNISVNPTTVYDAVQGMPQTDGSKAICTVTNGDGIASVGGILTPLFAAISVNASGLSNVVASVTGKRIRVLRYTLVVSAAVAAKFVSNGGTPTDLTGAMALASNSGVGGSYCPLGHFQTAVNEPLALNLSVAAQISGCLTYVLV